MADEVDAGAGRASVSYPFIYAPHGYGVLYIDDRTPAYFRVIQPGFNNVLTISPGVWCPGYRVPNGQIGGGFPITNTQAKGDEPIRLQPPPRGTGRLGFHTQAKVVIRNPDTARMGRFACALGVVYPNQANRPMWPYLGAVHDLDIRQLWPETIGPLETRSITMFRADFVDNALDGGIPGWPNWEMRFHEQTRLYPAVGISFRNAGDVRLEVGQVYAYGYVS